MKGRAAVVCGHLTGSRQAKVSRSTVGARSGPILHNENISYNHYPNGLFVICLSRPQALNSVTKGMWISLLSIFRYCETNQDVKVICVRGEGRAFCAGGDLKDFLRYKTTLTIQEYTLDYYLSNYPKLVISICDGIVMGGGVGLCSNGGIVIVTERTKWAMPEAKIGFFTDAGAGHFLNRGYEHNGMYLGLTGESIGPADLMFNSLAHYYIPSLQVPSLLEQLKSMELEKAGLDEFFSTFQQPPDGGKGKLIKYQEEILNCFGPQVKSVEEVLAKLRLCANSSWAQTTSDAILQNCPLSLKVTFKYLRMAKELLEREGDPVKEILKIEYRLSARMASGYNMTEGVRAKIISKDNNPKWIPETIEAVTENEVTELFVPFSPHEHLTELF